MKKEDEIMLRGKKAQAAMEFLMTYGWAILVVLIVIGALAYFGVLNPQSLLPEKCTMQTGFNCRNHIVNANGGSSKITIEVLNGMGRTIIIKEGSIANGELGNPINNCTTTANVTINNGATGEIVFENCGTTTTTSDTASKFRWNLGIKWHYADADVKYATTMNGELFATVQD